MKSESFLKKWYYSRVRRGDSYTNILLLGLMEALTWKTRSYYL